MKTRDQIVESLKKWCRNDTVGNLIIYHGPNSVTYDCIIERVVKAREMKPEIRAAFEMFMDELGIERGEVRRNADGKPDLVKFTRRFDCGDDGRS